MGQKSTTDSLKQLLEKASTVFRGIKAINIDSLKQLLEKAPNDTNRVNLLLTIANNYYFYKPDISIAYSKMALELAKDLDFKKGIFQSLSLAGESSRLLGNYPGSLKMQMEALEVSRKIKNATGEASSLCFIGVTYNELKEYRQGLNYLLPANAISQNLPVNPLVVFILTNMGISYNFLNMPDSALYYLRQAYLKVHFITHPQLESFIPINIGNVFARKGIKDSALFYYYKALQNSRSSNESINLGRVQQKIAELYFSVHQYDSSLYYVHNAFTESKRTLQKVNILEASILLVNLHKQFHQMDSAFYFEDIATAMKDSLYGPEKFKQLQLLMLDKQESQQKVEKKQEQYRNNIKYTLLFISMGVFLLISFILFRANRQNQKSKTKIEKAYTELKDTQAILIQREKMASLGELTAGIAHEIQNPLNFVNNFSEINMELLDEIEEVRRKPARTTGSDGKIEDSPPGGPPARLDHSGGGRTGDERAESEMLATVKENEEKINHHGKRADAIVKSMLQHARINSADAGQKELTDINQLAEEYLRLAYQGYRAKDKSFNCTLQLELDPNLPLVNVIPQDIGRVLLNLFNNAFWALSSVALAKEGAVSSLSSEALAKEEALSSEALAKEGTVTLSTKNLGNKIEIRVKDNGPGIPQKDLDKIFQPFFTTKPTGQGTGLGLSLAYDIVKANGGSINVITNYRPPQGELKMETPPGGRTGVEGEGTEFIIVLPI